MGGRTSSSSRRGRRKGARHFSSSTLRSYSGCLHAENQHTPKNDPFCSFFLQCIQTFWSKSFHLRRYWAKLLVKTNTCWILFCTLRSYYSRSPIVFRPLKILLQFLHCCQNFTLEFENKDSKIKERVYDWGVYICVCIMANTKHPNTQCLYLLRIYSELLSYYNYLCWMGDKFEHHDSWISSAVFIFLKQQKESLFNHSCSIFSNPPPGWIVKVWLDAFHASQVPYPFLPHMPHIVGRCPQPWVVEPPQ